MNQSEEYRKELLDHARNLYSDKRTPPAVHPRYGSVYSEFYGEPEEKTGTFGLRLMLAMLLFAAFITMDYQQMKVVNVSSAQIVGAIGQQADMEALLGD